MSNPTKRFKPCYCCPPGLGHTFGLGETLLCSMDGCDASWKQHRRNPTFCAGTMPARLKRTKTFAPKVLKPPTQSQQAALDFYDVILVAQADTAEVTVNDLARQHEMTSNQAHCMVRKARRYLQRQATFQES